MVLPCPSTMKAVLPTTEILFRLLIVVAALLSLRIDCSPLLACAGLSLNRRVVDMPAIIRPNNTTPEITTSRFRLFITSGFPLYFFLWVRASFLEGLDGENGQCK